MIQIYSYISWYLAIGAGTSMIGLAITRWLGVICGRLTARLDILQGTADSERVNQELREIREDFNNIPKWMLWWGKMVIFWPRSIVLYVRQSRKTIHEIKRLNNLLKEES